MTQMTKLARKLATQRERENERTKTKHDEQQGELGLSDANEWCTRFSIEIGRNESKHSPRTDCQMMYVRIQCMCVCIHVLPTSLQFS